MFEDQTVELLPARTTMTTRRGGNGGNGGNGGRGGNGGVAVTAFALNLAGINGGGHPARALA